MQAIGYRLKQYVLHWQFWVAVSATVMVVFLFISSDFLKGQQAYGEPESVYYFLWTGFDIPTAMTLMVLLAYYPIARLFMSDYHLNRLPMLWVRLGRQRYVWQDLVVVMLVSYAIGVLTAIGLTVIIAMGFPFLIERLYTLDASQLWLYEAHPLVFYSVFYHSIGLRMVFYSVVAYGLSYLYPNPSRGYLFPSMVWWCVYWLTAFEPNMWTIWWIPFYPLHDTHGIREALSYLQVPHADKWAVLYPTVYVFVVVLIVYSVCVQLLKRQWHFYTKGERVV